MMDYTYRHAIFSKDKVYRYLLSRGWSNRPFLYFIGLNCSTADAKFDDPTIRRVVGFANDWGYGGIRMMNAFAFRSPDPKVMKAYPNPIGSRNDFYIRRYCENKTVIVGWGNDGAWIGRDKQVLAILKEVGAKVFCLGTTDSGQPKHPLYLRKDLLPVPYP